MIGALFAQTNLTSLLMSPLTWGLTLGSIGLWLTLESNAERNRTLGKILASAGLVVLAIWLPRLSSLATWPQWIEQIVFWLMAGTAVGCSAAAITARNPVYTAIWFAGSLLGVAGLFMLQHAQFLGVATVVVYAGAIVVTFLFVLMLANPKGRARYDRISWSKFAAPVAILCAVSLLVVVVVSFETSAPRGDANVLAKDHMVQIGTELFGKHLIAVEVAGTLLLVAMVGAIAIVIQGKQRASAPLSDVESVTAGDARP